MGHSKYNVQAIAYVRKDSMGVPLGCTKDSVHELLIADLDPTILYADEVKSRWLIVGKKSIYR